MATKSPQPRRKADRNPAVVAAIAAFGALLREHLQRRGTRPAGVEPQAWTAQDFADCIPGRKHEQQTAPRTVEYWLAGRTLPEPETFTSILLALFGPPPQGGADRQALRETYEVARRAKGGLILAQAPRNPAGEIAVAVGDRIGFNRTPAEDDVTAAQDPAVQAEHPGVIEAARELAALAARRHNQITDEFADLRSTTERFLAAIDCDIATLPHRLASAYQACVTLASLHELDGEYRDKREDGEQPLPTDLRMKLGLVLALAAPFLHAFPYVQRRDRSLRTFMRAGDVDAARQMARGLDNRRDLMPEASALLREMLATSMRRGTQAEKARDHLVGTVTNILLFGGAGRLGAPTVLDPTLRARLNTLFQEEGALIARLATHLSPAVRAALRHASDLSLAPHGGEEDLTIEEILATIQRILAEEDTTPAPAPRGTQPGGEPDIEEVKRMILAGRPLSAAYEQGNGKDCHSVKSRTDHIAWARIRALKLIDGNQLSEAVEAHLQDLGEHPEIAGTKALAEHGMQGQHLALQLSDRAAMRGWVSSFK